MVKLISQEMVLDQTIGCQFRIRMAETGGIKEIVSNRKASFQYEILETFEVGLCLQGTEVKSLRQGGGSLQEAFVSVDSGELWLVGSTITAYRFGNIHNHEERRKRKLLAHKKEIIKISTSIQEKGLTCIPLSLYFKEGRVKLKIALARGKKLHDKRTAIKEREEKREVTRAMKQYSQS